MDWPVPVLIVAGAVAWFGHGFLLTAVLNWVYAQAWPRSILKAIRTGIAFGVVVFPLGFGFFVSRPLFAESTVIRGYVLGCLATAIVYLPIISIIRALRRTPAAVVDNSSHIVDIAALLGSKPVGDGKKWRWACLPGNQIFQVQFRELAPRLPRVPAAWDGLTILHVSDIHLCGTPGREFFQQALDHAMQSGAPDIVALTGDVVDSAHHHRWILPLLGRLNWTVAAFAILGNHDGYYEPELVRRRLKRIGFRVLGNSWEQIDARGKPLIVIGNETPWFEPSPDLSHASLEPFRLCLSHTPDNFGWAQRNRIDLMLAGHVHGGQIRFPGIGPLFVPSRFSRRYDSEQFEAGPTLMCVSRGLSGGEPLRYNCRPEVTRITLRAATPQ